MDLSAKIADKIIAVSEHTKSDIVESIGVDPGKIDVIPLAVDPEIFGEISQKFTDSEIRNRFDLKEKFILYTGSDFPHKNLKTLVAAFDRLVKDRRIPHDLVVVGPKMYERQPEVQRSIEELGERVKLLGHVTDEELAALYRAASLFVFPSLYEGFGFPPLEAMISGTPVVASNSASIPEVVGDAALVSDCKRPEVLSKNIYKVISNEELQHDLVEAGFDRVKEFDWKETAEDTIDTYEKLLHTSRKDPLSNLKGDVKHELNDLMEEEGEKNPLLREVINNM